MVPNPIITQIFISLRHTLGLWMLKLTTRPEHSLRTLQKYLAFNATRKQFEPGPNLFTFPGVHSAPLNRNIDPIIDPTSACFSFTF